MKSVLRDVLKTRKTTTVEITAQLEQLDQLEVDAVQTITRLDTKRGELLVDGAADATIAKLERELATAREDAERIRTALAALRVKHDQVALQERQTAELNTYRAGLKALKDLPKSLERYPEVAAPVVDALTRMRRAASAAVSVGGPGDGAITLEILGRAKVVANTTRIPSVEQIERIGANAFWPFDIAKDSEFPMDVTGRGRRKVGDWPLDLREAGHRAAEALDNYERSAPNLRNIVEKISALDTEIVAAKCVGKLDAPEELDRYRPLAERFLNKVSLPDIPEDAPRFETLGMSRRAPTPHFAGVED